ncbi:MAG: D-2-hydroxyacid dehydrogenase [Bacteroidales bacterium]|nr:D-2-hydroxyacid dehydrogenase [Bacteroidales bacterium]MBN2818827.1 D-2-hydroxyacid dehydrogenase [Bacteroidales bacterium]
MNNINIAFLDASTIGKVKAIDKIKSAGNYKSYELTKPEERIDRIKGNQVIITNKVIIDKEIMDACPDLKLICISATGMNNVDLDYAGKKGIIVKNVAGYSTESVAQSTFSMLLGLLNNIVYYDRYVKSGEYAKSPIFTHQGRSYYELKGKQFGIIGLGTIGKRVAEIATAFGCKVVYFSTSGKNMDASYPHLSFDEMLTSSDIISIHCPLNDKTQNLFDYEQFKQMKSSAILLNAGRGKIVNETGLANALNDNLIAAAGLDVLEFEPIKATNPLLRLKNPEKLLITPHIAWISDESREKLVEGVYNNITEWIKMS